MSARGPALRLRLYVAGDAPNSTTALARLRRALDRVPNAKLEVIDVLEVPERALEAGILVTPTLVRVSPAPERRLIGNLSDASRLDAALGIAEAGDD